MGVGVIWVGAVCKRLYVLWLHIICFQREIKNAHAQIIYDDI
jgi:hypothetical protein